MKKNLLKILSYNERFSYSLTGKLRQIILPFFNTFLKIKEKRVRKRINLNLNDLVFNLTKILPEVTTKDLNGFLSYKEKKQIISLADDAIKKKFNILNVKINFDNKIDWHLDFSSGNRWAKGKIYHKYNQVNIDNNADVKFPRELSRCHHFLHLGQAYLITEDEKYIKEFINQINDWIDENPYKKSINWGCSMDIAIRASNWIYALRMMEKSSLLDDKFFSKIFTSLYLHGKYIYEHPEKNRVYNHNHYLSDLAGQILISLLFKNNKFTEPRLWEEDGIYELYREIRVQILPSGFTYERTTNYHRLVTELISYTIVLLKNNNVEVPQDISFRIKKMFEVIKNYIFINGQAPIIGDQDNGRFLPFYPYDINYQKYLLDIGATLFKDNNFKEISEFSTIDTLFLFGKSKVSDFLKLEAKKIDLISKSYPDVGFYLMKTSDVYVFINNSGLSHYNEVPGGTHTHSDLLSFVYAYKGIPFIIDPGSYVYSSAPEERMKFRSTYMHNTITVDGLSQNDLKKEELWSISRDAIPNSLYWESNSENDVYVGAHNGYERLQDPVNHTRTFRLDKEKSELIIKDKISCISKHHIESHIHFDEGVKVYIVDKKVICEKSDEKILISFDLDNEYKLELTQEYISRSYNSKTLASYLNVSFFTEKDIELKTIIEKHD